jgi:adenylyltransferase/sulfurtransferase
MLYIVFVHGLTWLSQDVPLDELIANPATHLPENDVTEVYVVCRLGNDSQTAAEALRGACRISGPGNIVIKDVIGGLRAWARDVDTDFPVY